MSKSVTVSDVDQCIAITSSGERCTRPARDGAFCYQHDKDSPTLEQAEDVDADSVEEALEEVDEIDTPDPPEIEAPMDLSEIRERVQATADQIIGRPLDGIVSIHGNDEGWVVRVDCLERKAVPDTQDILGQYEIEFTDDGTVSGYSRLHRYRRGDTGGEDVGSVIDGNN